MSQRKMKQPLLEDQLRKVCDPATLPFETTASLPPTGSIIGQPRGTRAIEFGIDMSSPGYNIFVMGDRGTGRTTTIRRFLEERAAQRSRPDDWVYVNNFTLPHQPQAIRLPPGDGAVFKREMAQLLQKLQEDLLKAFTAEQYRNALEKVEERFQKLRNARLAEIRARAGEQGFALVETSSGPHIAPVSEGQLLPQEALDALPPEQRSALLEQQQSLENDLDETFDAFRDMDSAYREEITSLRSSTAERAIAHHFRQYREMYKDKADIRDYLNDFQQDVMESLDDFLPHDEAEMPPDLGRYEVNLLVDNSQTAGAPVITEPNPTYGNLVGRIEYELIQGMMITHFSNLKPGCLHRANGGYLILYANDILRHLDAWAALKRALSGSEIRFQSPDAVDGPQVIAKTLDPQPIPFSVKVILLGATDLYYSLLDEDEEFGKLFKVKADFDSTMPRNQDNEHQYAYFVASRCHEEGLLHFDRTAVAKIIEFGSRLCGDQERLSTRFGDVADAIREASHWAVRENQQVVSASHVQRALNERRYRHSLVEEKVRAEVEERLVFIDTAGMVVGQVNGLSILDLGDYSFARPTRITAKTYMGESGVVNIEREVDMAGPLHNKGLLALTGYLGGTYAQDQPLSLSASLTFEQNYTGIDGDSASSAELYALLSSLSRLPLKQSIAVTGSVDQLGELQPIGSVTEKVEGFYETCLLKGLNGEQGVIIPAASRRHLMLREDVVEAAAAGRFHIWAIETIDEGIELLTGVSPGKAGEDGHYPADSVHGLVQQRLLSLAKGLKKFGSSD